MKECAVNFKTFKLLTDKADDKENYAKYESFPFDYS